MLAAGFIGQFGKRLADHLVSRTRARRATIPSPPPPSPQESAGDLRAKTEAKMAKKAAKAEVKRRK